MSSSRFSRWLGRFADVERDPAAARYRRQFRHERRLLAHARSTGVGGRNNETSHQRETAGFRVRVFVALAEWIDSQWTAEEPGRVLDFGCGDLLIAGLLDHRFVVDGYDESGTARTSARATLAELGAPGTVFDRLEDIPGHSYDAVVINSLFQYIPTPEEAGVLFEQAAACLKQDATIGIVVTDGCAEDANRLIDLVDLIRFSVALAGWVGGFHALVAGIGSGRPSRRYRLDEVDLAPRAEQVGLRLRRLERNLTVFSRRATFVLLPNHRGGDRP